MFNFSFPLSFTVGHILKLNVKWTHISGCGVKHLEGSGRKRIVGGAYTDTWEWPWQVLIEDSLDWARCGGTMLNDEWIMNAAHL